MSNKHSSFHVIDLKLDIKASIMPKRLAAASDVAARWVTLHPIGGV